MAVSSASILKKKNFKNKDFVVEDYFPITTIKKFRSTNHESFLEIQKKINKRDLVNYIKNLDKSYFSNFSVLFDLILKIKNKD